MVTIDTAIRSGITEDPAGSQVPTRVIEEKGGRRSEVAPQIEIQIRETALTRTLRSHQLWLTLTYLGLLILMGRGIAS